MQSQLVLEATQGEERLWEITCLRWNFIISSSASTYHSFFSESRKLQQEELEKANEMEKFPERLDLSRSDLSKEWNQLLSFISRNPNLKDLRLNCKHSS